MPWKVFWDQGMNEKDRWLPALFGWKSQLSDWKVVLSLVEIECIMMVAIGIFSVSVPAWDFSVSYVVGWLDDMEKIEKVRLLYGSIGWPSGILAEFEFCVGKSLC